MTDINISHLSKAEALRRLWNGALNHVNHGQLMAMVQLQQPRMTLEQAQTHVASSRNLYFDYVDGRCLKVNLSKDTLNPALYDRDSGPGAAARALARCQ
jgi:hypothetical protein